MDLTKYSTEELRNKVKCCELQIEMCKERIKRIDNEIDDYAEEETKYQAEIDKREIELAVDMTFEEQCNYFFSSYDSNRSIFHYRKCDSFFDVLSLRVNPNAKSVRFKAHPDFIKNNREYIKQYLPIAFKFCYEKYRMETTPYHTITVECNMMVDIITYYPETDEYYTDGVYIRNFKTLDEVLDHMLEEV